jgi:hypothetical protein
MSSVPIQLTRTRKVMTGYQHDWYLCGGWAVDAWLGKQTRTHLDVDIAVFHDDQDALYEHLNGWDLIGHDPNVPDDSPDPWNGRHLDIPAHIHANTAAMHGVELDIQINATLGGRWVCRKEPLIVHNLSRQTASPWQLPTAPPELVLFYKAGGNLAADQLNQLRQHDEQDFRALIPSLTDEQHRWLRTSINRVHPNHPWRSHLTELE